MARNTTIASLTSAIRAPFQKRSGQKLVAANGKNIAANADVPSYAFDNTFEQRWRNAANTSEIVGLSVDASDRVLISEEVYAPMRKTSTVNMSVGVSDCITQAIFVAPTACRITGIMEFHDAAETTATTLTAYVEKLTGTTAPGSGSTVMTGTFNMKATAATVQTATLYNTGTGDADDPRLWLAAGDRLGIVYSGAADDLARVQITLAFAPAGDALWVPVVLTANGKMIDQHFFVADQDYIVTGAYEAHSTKASVASKLQITKCTGAAQAPASGTALLTNNTNTGFDVAGANNTVLTGTLTATAASLRLAPGNTLAFDFGTTTALAGVVVIVTLQSKERWKTVSFQSGPNASLADMSFFTADRNYQIMAAAAIWTTAAGSGNTQLTRDTGTTACGAGTNLLSMDTNSGWQTDATAATTEVATFIDARFNYLMAGDRLSVDYSVTTSLVGFCCTVALRPC